MLNVKIEIDDGKGKKANIELSESDNLSKLVIIQNVFNLFGVNTDITEQIATFDKAAKAYTKFFDTVTPIEPAWNEQLQEQEPQNQDLDEGSTEDSDSKSNDIKQQMIQSYETNKDELESTYKSDHEPLTDHLDTGIKYKNGKPLYRLRYECPACYNRGSHFVYLNSKVTWCHRCRHEMKVLAAHPSGNLESKDTYGNFLRAGDYKDVNLDWNKAEGK